MSVLMLLSCRTFLISDSCLCKTVFHIIPRLTVSPFLSTEVYEGEYLGQKVAVKNIKCDVTAQAFLSETAVMT